MAYTGVLSSITSAISNPLSVSSAQLHQNKTIAKIVENLGIVYYGFCDNLWIILWHSVIL